MFSGIPTHHIAYIYGDPKKVKEHVSRKGNRKIYYNMAVVLS